MNRLLFCLLAALAFGAEAKTFDSGDRVVFFGDSITHVGAWTRDIMLYYVTRYPDRDVVFMNGGQGGGTAYNARRERIGQDVFSRKPTDVVLMFGVNDLRRFDYETNATPEKIAAQRKSIADYGVSIRGLLQDLRGGVPEATLYCLTPVPCDDTATSAPNAGSLAGANGGITAESQLLVDAVAEAGATLVDANAAVNAYIRRRRLAEPDVVFSSDRVHLNEAIHFLMASTFLKTQAVSPIVSDVRLMEGRVLGARNASVTDLQYEVKRKGEGEEMVKITFTVLEKALPWPTDKEEKEVADRIPVGDDFNQQILAFHSLPSGRWTLRIDGEDIVTADERVWALGVNLGEIRTTPQYRQALAVRAQLKKDYATMIQRQAAGFSIRRAIQVLMERKGLNPASPEDRKAWYAEKRPTLKGSGLRDYDAVMANYDRLDEWAAECDAFFPALRALAKPVPHRYELVRAGTDDRVRLIEQCWMWGHETGQVDGTNNQWKLDVATSYYHMCEGARSLGIENLNVVRWDRPDRAFRDSLKGLKKVTWPVSGIAHSGSAGYDELADWCFAVADEMPNVTGFDLDDFFMPDRKTQLTAETPEGPRKSCPTRFSYAKLLQLKRRMQAYSRPLELRLVTYDILFKDCVSVDDLKPSLALADTLTYWTWKAENLGTMRENVARLRTLAPGKNIQLGIYLWDFGACREMPLERMEYQLREGLELWRTGAIDGFVFLCSSICNRKLPAVDCARDWLRRHADEVRLVEKKGV